ncbi:DUF4912 domain-containing protein [Natroniella sulfidigena]|uniref:DUF4912 domain-containing protein n=1 Tax=Natroniella sulfidigena TaxID=723921 RepID=UPI00200B846E|nr:DUF4912 domain-containing protein [Natroniella sulfidigena]MCK8817197.1 DUF4912 domain-containing protein [Natroniella sulfidigena]
MLLLIYSLIAVLVSGVIFYFLWLDRDDPGVKSETNQHEDKAEPDLNKLNYELEAGEELTQFDSDPEFDNNLLVSNYWKHGINHQTENLISIPHDAYINIPALSEELLDDLRDNVCDNKLALLTQSPTSIHAYWDASCLELEEGQPTLRVYDLTAGEVDNYFDIEISPTTDNWYIEVPHANHEYYAEIGLLTENQLFITLAKSNPVLTPTDQPEFEYGDLWMKVVDQEKEYVPYQPDASLESEHEISNTSSSTLFKKN